MLEIKVTKQALTEGYWFATKEYCREWEKYSVVEPKSKTILLTSSQKYNAENFISYLQSSGPLPRFYSNKVVNYWRKNANPR